ncbi:MAG: flavodoxin family protein, partial [bacterium]|nr:flavodoxin family protein [bacterium]
MKIIILNSSYRKKGNTGRIVGLLEEILQQAAARSHEPLETEIIHLAHQKVLSCQGCRICFDRGEEFCPLKDDLQAIKKKIKEADAMVLASPVYVNDVNGVMKNWIDRLAHVCHRPEFYGKSAYLLATTGQSPCIHTLNTMNLAIRTWGITTLGRSGFI